MCGRVFTAEKNFVYTDFERGLIVSVHPPGHSSRWRRLSSEFDRAMNEIDSHGVVPSKLRRRIAFGIGELREKLAAEDGGLDDRIAELTKVLAIHEHPILLRRPRLRLFLSKVHADRLEFFAGYDHAEQAFKIEMPSFVPERLEAGNTGVAWTEKAQRQSLFNLGFDHWISFRRWSPSNAASGTLHDYAERVRAGQSIALDNSDFQAMIRNLASASQLSTADKVDLRDIEKYALAQGRADIQDQLFEKRFGVLLDDEWGSDRKAQSIDTLWDLLKDLPDTNVVGNTSLREIFLQHGDGGGLYNPQSDDVTVTTDPTDASSFQNTVRHEIGHAVHARLDAQSNLLVTRYLQSQFGWQVFDGNAAGARAWVDTMNGWGGLAESDRRRIADMLVKALGNGSSWNPPPPPNPPPTDPWWSDGFGPRLAVEGSKSQWFAWNTLWYRNNGKAFFLNYWYRQFMVVEAGTVDFIDEKMPWNYAAMSPSEFFAELYALYYRLDSQWRPNIDQPVRDWFDANIGPPRTGAPAPPP